MVERCRESLSLSRRDWLVGFGILAAAVGATGCSMRTPSKSLIAAVYDRDERRVRELIAAKADLEERKSDGSTPLLLAVDTDQFEIAKDLIDAGADIWATSEFGDSVGWATEHCKVVGGQQADARRRVLVKLRDLGFSFPAEHRSIVLRKIEAGEWPPKRAAMRR